MAREKLIDEIFRTVPEDRLAVAAVLAMQARTGVAAIASRDELLAFINSLNRRDLKRLRKLALSLIEDGTEGVH